MKCRFSQLVLLSLLGILLISSGCAFTPKPVVLLDKDSKLEQLPENGLKVSLLVTDTRPEAVKKMHMCGIMRNTYMMPTSFAFLAHSEPLDVIVARQMKGILERAGYKVVATMPKIPAQESAETLKTAPLTEQEQKAVLKSVSDDNRADLEAAKDKEGTAIADLTQDSEGALPIPQELFDGADAVVKVTIDKYSSDVLQAIIFVSVQGWADFKLSAIEGPPGKERFLYGKTFKGFGTSGPRQIVTEDCFIMAVNGAHHGVMSEIEKALRSREFLAVLKPESTGRVSSADVPAQKGKKTAN